jgi:hypothetical protein
MIALIQTIQICRIISPEFVLEDKLKLNLRSAHKILELSIENEY